MFMTPGTRARVSPRVRVGRVPRTLQNKSREFVSVLDFGGQGLLTGGRGLSAAISAALSVSNSVYFPPSTAYRLDKWIGLPSNKTIWGVPGTVTINVPANIDQTGVPTVTTYLTNTGSTDITIDGLTFDGGAVNTYRVTFITTTRLKFQNCRFTNHNAQGGTLFTQTELAIINCQFDHMTGDGWSVDGADQATIVGNLFTDNGDYGFAGVSITNSTVTGNVASGNTNTGIGLSDANNTTVSGNSADHNGVGIWCILSSAGCTDIVFANNTTKANTTTGIQVSNTTGAVISGNDTDGETTGIRITDSTNFVITGNSINHTDHGILIQAFTGNTGGGIVTGNRVTGGNFGIRELASGGTITTSQIALNRVSGAATANYSVTSDFGISGDFTITAAGVGAVTLTTGSSNFVRSNSPTLVTPTLGAATATTINGVTIDNNAWTTYSPSVTANAGSFTTISAAGRYKDFGKTRFIEVEITITSVGTASLSATVPLPNGTSAARGAMIANDANDGTASANGAVTFASGGSAMTWAPGSGGTFQAHTYMISGVLEMS